MGYRNPCVTPPPFKQSNVDFWSIARTMSICVRGGCERCAISATKSKYTSYVGTLLLWHWGVSWSEVSLSHSHKGYNKAKWLVCDTITMWFDLRITNDKSDTITLVMKKAQQARIQGGGQGGLAPPPHFLGKKNKGAKNHTHRKKMIKIGQPRRYRLKRTPKHTKYAQIF